MSTTPAPAPQNQPDGYWVPPVRTGVREPLETPVEPQAPALVYAVNGRSFVNRGSGVTTFPLLQTAVDTDFAGDLATTMQGATLNLDGTSGRYGLTLNNAALDVVDATATTVGNPAGAPITGGRTLAVGVNTLEYTAYGAWLIESPTAGVLNSGAWLTGFVTPPSALPVTGTASYSGSIAGAYDEGTGATAGVYGNIQVQADFAAHTVSGTMTNVRPDAGNFLHTAVNDIAFSATFNPAQNQFSGTTRVLNVPAGATAFTADASGVVSGRFFGPAAEQVGGVWTLSDASRRIIGSFGAAR